MKVILSILTMFIVVSCITGSDLGLCVKDDDCRFDEYCKVEPGAVEGECTSRPICDNDSDCPEGWECGITGYCEQSIGVFPDDDEIDADSFDNNPAETTFPQEPEEERPDPDFIEQYIIENEQEVPDPEVEIPVEVEEEPDIDTEPPSGNYFFDNFESGTTNWDLEGQWQIGVPTSGPSDAYSGNNVAATNLNGDYWDGANYLMIMTTSFQVPTNAENPVLEFRAYVDTEGSRLSANDYMIVLIRQPWESWDIATRAVLTADISEQRALLDSTFTKINGYIDSAWHLFSTSLEGYKGVALEVGFRFLSDDNSHKTGIYLDDIVVYDK